MAGVFPWISLRKLPRLPATNHIPVVALTAHALADDRAKAIAAGCDDYVTKPVDMAKLLEIIGKLIGPGDRD